jgi:NAD(P)-dependent dehydrogenase (short-subunit alcohol dehydrogenase family)
MSSTPSPRIAVVTGAARGLGAAIADRLAQDGYVVVRLDRDVAATTLPPLRLTSNQTPSRPDTPQPSYLLNCDVADPNSVRAAAAQVETWGPVAVLVNNAGTWSFGPLETVSSEEFARVLDVNLRGTFHCTQSFGASMVAAGCGSIVNVVSIAAEAANPRVGAYSASKAGVLAFTRQTALEWGPFGVRANAVGPGFVPTPGTSDVYDDPAIRDVRAGAVPLRRLGTPDDVAGVVSFLASDDAAYVTGQVLYVDGGVSESLMTLIPRPGLPTPSTPGPQGQR